MTITSLILLPHFLSRDLPGRLFAAFGRLRACSSGRVRSSLCRGLHLSFRKTTATLGAIGTDVATIGVLFFIFGFVTWLNGPLITFVKLAFALDDVSAFLVPMAFYLSYFFLALPASAILRRTGMKQGMAIGLFVMAIGSVLFGEFTTMRQYSGTLAGLFVIGAGLSLLQTASNPYVCIIGPHRERGPAHRLHGDLPQVRRLPRAFRLRGAGPAKASIISRRASRTRRPRKPARPCSMPSPPACTDPTCSWPRCSRCSAYGSLARDCRTSDPRRPMV